MYVDTYVNNQWNNIRVSSQHGMVWFSYSTPIAFQPLGETLIIRQNDWSATTGKHLNAINADKDIRVTGERFEKLFHKSKLV